MEHEEEVEVHKQLVVPLVRSVAILLPLQDPKDKVGMAVAMHQEEEEVGMVEVVVVSLQETVVLVVLDLPTLIY
jgi:uncharacterized protein (DUF2237 family)